jgi:hypothetical protein
MVLPPAGLVMSARWFDLLKSNVDQDPRRAGAGLSREALGRGIIHRRGGATQLRPAETASEPRAGAR